MSVDLPLVARGKVREIYDAGSDRLLLVASDRISAYDHVLPTPIPDKGRVLTALSVWWFEQLTPVLASFGASHHLVSATDVPGVGGRPGDAGPPAGDAAGRVRGPRLPVRLGHGRVPAHRRHPGRRRCRPGWSRARGCRRRCSRRRPRPRWASTTRRSTSPTVVALVGADRAAELRELTLALYRRGAEIAEAAGIVLADTKFEFGARAAGRLVLGDEVLTPDSSRFWPAVTWSPGAAQPSFDKQYVRDWLTASGLGPRLPAAGAPRRRRRRHPRALRHRLRAAHRPRPSTRRSARAECARTRGHRGPIATSSSHLAAACGRRQRRGRPLRARSAVPTPPVSAARAPARRIAGRARAEGISDWHLRHRDTARSSRDTYLPR